MASHGNHSAARFAGDQPNRPRRRATRRDESDHDQSEWQRVRVMAQRIYRLAWSLFIVALALYIAARVLQSVWSWLVLLVVIVAGPLVLLAIFRYRRSHW